LTLINFLWKSIYGSEHVLNGMSFNDVFVYLALASTIFSLFMTSVDWDMSFSVVDGSIITSLVKPLDHQMNMLAGKIGMLALNFTIISIPSFLFLIFVFQVKIAIGWNLLFFFISVVFSFLISFTIEYIVGLISFYTQSIWGISASKNVIVMLLSGAVVPLSFFPEGLRKIADVLPFKAMYDIPLRMIISPPASPGGYLSVYLFQIGWLIVIFIISRLFFKQAIKVVTVNGG
jgi:ABC-2 type transport system permease protein